jgi:O-antigen ligase
MERIPSNLAVVSNIDNMWLENLVNVGLLGSVPILVAIVLGVRSTRSSLASNQEASGRYIAQAGLIAFLLLASVYNPSINTLGAVGMIFAFILMLPPEVRTDFVDHDQSSAVGIKSQRSRPILAPRR